MENEDKDMTFGELFDREMRTMDILLTGKAMRTAVTLEEYFKMRLEQGVLAENIGEELKKDLLEGGPLFNEFRNAIKATAHGNFMRIRDVSQFSENGLNIDYRWSAVLVNTCEDCLDRHGEVKTWDEWESEGMPRTGHTRCGQNCRCVLLPAHTTVLEPIKRGG